MSNIINAEQWPFNAAPLERLYVIGDIHGEYNALKSVITTIERDLKARPPLKYRIIFLGDYIDRGEDSRGVVDLVSTLCVHSSAIALQGNHEAMMLEALDDRDCMLDWRQYGGLETMASFDVPIDDLMRGRDIGACQTQFRAALGIQRYKFIKTLSTFYQSGDYFFCHAGIRPGVPLIDQDINDLIRIREPFLSSHVQHEKIIIHGHTPVEEIEFRMNRINIDTGAYLTGRLTCLVIEGNKIEYFDSKSPHITNIFYG